MAILKYTILYSCVYVGVAGDPTGFKRVKLLLSELKSYKQVRCALLSSFEVSNKFRVSLHIVFRTSLLFCLENIKTIIEGLLPQHEFMAWSHTLYIDENDYAEEARVTNEELIAVAKTLKPNKAPGLDGIPNLALKTVIQANPDMF